MELTKKDKKHIEEEVTKLMFRFNVECTEYARLYERTYLEELQKKIGEKIEFLDLYAHQQRIASENKESKQVFNSQTIKRKHIYESKDQNC